MELVRRLTDLKEDLSQGMPRPVKNLMQRIINKIQEEEIAERASEILKFPDDSLLDISGNVVQLKDILASKKKTIVNIFRGEWCPYCNIELQAYEEQLSLIKRKGAQVIAISPQTPPKNLRTFQNLHINFNILSDLNNRLLHKLKLTYKLDKDIQNLYKQFGFSLPDLNGNTSWELPLPASYIVNQNGDILTSFIDNDPCQRAEPSDLINLL